MKNIRLLLLLLPTLFFVQACDLFDDDDDDNTPPVVEVPEPTGPTTNIVETAVAAGSFNTLVAALQATGLDATLSDANASFTVFAPTDDAFALLGQDAIDGLLADTDTLSGILTYHVLGSSVNAETAIGLAGTTVETVNGASIGLSQSDGSLLVNNATVITTDIETTNGIIHVIDAVMMPPTPKGTPTANIVETAVSAGTFNTLVAALQAAGLDGTLADETQSFTVFAPTDDAFAMLGDDMINALLADTDTLTSILLQHVVAGEVSSTAAYTLNGQSAPTLAEVGIPVAVNTDADTLTFGGATIVTKDIYTTNGVIHVIDMVVTGDVALPTPPQSIVDVAVGAGSFNTLVAALQATGLDATLANLDETFTVFAPTDEAFALLGQDTIDALLADTETLSNILLYHVVSGSSIMQDAAVTKAQSDDKSVAMANMANTSLSFADSTLFVNKSSVSAADVMASNGVIHVIDQVILPPTAKGTPTMNIVETAVATPELSTLVTALQTADLVDTLADENSTFTVFAPTNNAFAKLDSAVLTALLGDVPALTGVLLKHVISGAEVNSLGAFAANGAMVDTTGGDKIGIALVNFAATMNEAKDEVAYDKASQMLVGGMNSATAGNTLYVFDDDLGGTGSVCNDTCATNWPPVTVTDGELDNIPGLSMITRDDGTMQAAYLGRPLYFYVGDTAAGQMTGNGVNDKWWTVKLDQVSLQVQGSNVTQTDVYTTNGVVHIIDTVITD